MIRALLAVLCAGIFLILGIPVLGILYLYGKKNPIKAEHIALRFMQVESRLLCFICCVKLDVRGLDKIPDEPVLYVANHNSIFDCLCLYPVLPERFGFIAKDSLNKVPSLRVWMARTNTLYLNRKDPREGMKVILKAIDMVKEGISIFIFPEGTRGDSEEMGEFKAGSFKVASKTNCPIVPVTISGTRNILYNHIPFVKSSHVIISFGDAIYLDQLEADQTKNLAAYVQNIIQTTKNKQEAE